MKNRFSFIRLAQIFSYRIILTVIILFFTVLSSVVTFAVAKHYVNRIITNQYVSDYMNTVESNLSKNISALIYRMNTLSIYFTTNSYVYSTIQDTASDYNTVYNKLNNEFRSFWENESIIQGVSIITEDGNMYNFAPDAAFNAFCKADFAKSIGDSPIYLSDYCTKSENDTYYIMAGKKLYNYFTGNYAGYLVMYINESVFSELYKNYTFADTNFYITLNNTIISHSDKKMINSTTYPINVFFGSSTDSFKVNNFLVSKRKIDLGGIINDMCVISVTDFSKFTSMLSKINFKFMLTLLAAVALSVIFAFIISMGLLSEIEILRKNIIEFKNSPSTYVPNFKLNEIKSLEYDFTAMTHRINRLIETIKVEKEKQKQSELLALQAQINPHFIYNTLDSIAWMALMDKNTKIYETICSFSDFFRISLNKGRSIISIKEEIEHVKSYVAIEQMRFPDKFEVEYLIDDNIMKKNIIKIILQPLVENAIKHGFETMKTGGKITISGHYTDKTCNTIILTVTDNGCGTDTNPRYTKKSDKPHSGYGLNNINERLRLACGTTAELSLKVLRLKAPQFTY